MPQAPRLSLSENAQKLLEKWSRGGSTPYRIVVRSRIVLLASRGYSNRSIARQLRINPITVARWRSRFLLLGIEGIRHEAPRLGSTPPISKEFVRAILHKTLFERPPQASRWSTRSLARAVGVSHSTVRRVWKTHEVRPPRSRVATLARDTRFQPKSIDVVGVYVNPPQRALAISLRDDEGPRTKIPADGRALPSFRPVPKGRSWMGDLVSTLNLLDNRELKGSAQRLVDPEFLSFLHSVQGRRQGRERIQLLARSVGVTTPVPLSRWLERHPEFSAHVRFGSAPLRQIVVEWFGDVLTERPTDTPPASLPGLRTAVERWARETSDEPRPFVWTRK
jgi:hypothetical protein